MKKILLFLVLMPYLLFADAVIFSGNDVKALKQNLDLFGVVKVMSGSLNPSAGAGVAAPQGSAYLSTVHGLYLKTGAANTAWTKNSLVPVDLTSEVTGILPIANGGTGSATKNFVDLTTGQTIAGTKTFSSTIVGDISGNAATVTTNANLTGDVTSVGNATTYNGIVPVNKGGTGSATQNFVDLTTNQTVAGEKTLSNRLYLTEIGATTTTGVDIHNNSGTQVARFGAGGGTSVSLNGTTNIGTSSADHTQITGGTGTVTQTAIGSSTNIDINLVPKGSGKVNADKLSTIDNTFSINDISDPTKKINFDASGTTGTLTTIAGSQTANRLITLPDLTTTLVGTNGAQTISDKTFVAPILGEATGTSLALGGTINANAVADFQSTTKAFMPPRMTTTQKNAIPPTAGMLVYDTTIGALSYYDGTQWVSNLTIANDGPVETFTPTINNVTLGTGGTTYGFRKKNGDTVSYWVGFTLGTGGAVSGDITFVPPDTINSSKARANQVIGGVTAIAGLNNPGSANINGSVTSIVFKANAASSNMNATSPFTWASTNSFQASVIDMPYVGGAVSTSAILSSNADYGFTPCTATLTNAGNATQALQCKRSGDTMIIRGRVTIGSTLPTGNITFTIPGALSANTTVTGTGGTLGTATASVNSPFFPVGTAQLQSSTTFAILTVGANALWNATNPATWVAGQYFELNNLIIPISGWTQSPLAIIPLSGALVSPGYTGQVEDFDFSYGGSSLTTNCTTGTCFLEQNGTPGAMTSVVWSSTGIMNATTARTYIKIRCVGNSLVAASGAATMFPISVNNTNTFVVRNERGGASADTYGTVRCKGYY